jgi:hypothetical protein
MVWLFPIPSGVEIIRAYLVKDEEGSNLAKSVSSVVVSKVYYFIAFGILITLSTLIVIFIKNSSIPVKPVYIWFVTLYAFINTVIFAILLTPNNLYRIYNKSPEWIQQKFFDRIYNLSPRKNGFKDFVDELDSSLKMIRKKF